MYSSAVASNLAQLKMLLMIIFCICIVVNDHSGFLYDCFLLAVNVMDEVDKSCRAVCWAKGHHGLGPFDGSRVSECKRLLTGEGNGQLVIPHGFPMPKSSFIAESQHGIG